MKLEVVRAGMDDFFPGVFAVGIGGSMRPPGGEAGLLDWRLSGAISRLVLQGFLKGAVGEKTLFWSRRRRSKIYLFGAGAAPRPSGKTVADCAENLVRVLLRTGESEVVLLAERLLGAEEDVERALAFLSGLIAGGRDDSELFKKLRLVVVGEPGGDSYYEALRKAVLRKGMEAESVELFYRENAQILHA